VKVELLVSEWCPTCPATERVWRDLAVERDFRLAVLDLAQPEGRALAAALRIRSIPATVVDGRLEIVGVPTPEQARALVAAAPLRQKNRAYHAGMMLSRDNRAFVVSAMVWLVLAAVWLVIQRDLLADARGLPSGLHMLLAGCVLPLIYGTSAHMLPRFTGNPIRAGGLAALQFAAAQIGAALLVGGFVFDAHPVRIAGGVFVWLGLVAHAVRILPVLWPPR